MFGSQIKGCLKTSKHSVKFSESHFVSQMKLNCSIVKVTLYEVLCFTLKWGNCAVSAVCGCIFLFFFFTFYITVTIYIYRGSWSQFLTNISIKMQDAGNPKWNNPNLWPEDAWIRRLVLLTAPAQSSPLYTTLIWYSSYNWPSI